MGRIVVVSTGGTISMVHDPRRGGAVPTLDGPSLLAQLPRELGEIEIVEHSKVPSGYFTIEDIWAIRNRAQAYVLQPDVAGIVIIQGTDVLEEVAYLLDITVPGEKPVVVTGAMRTASQVGWDGGANILAAIRVAADAAARGLGTLVVLNDEIHAARHVTKMHTLSIDTFKSPEWGPIGRVNGVAVTIAQRVARDLVLAEGLMGPVPLIKLVVGADTGFLDWAIEQHVPGIVLEVFGSGRVPPWWMPGIRRAVCQGTAVVVTSRCPTGRMYDSYGFEGAYRGLAEAGVLFANGLNGPKARIRLMAALNVVERRPVSLSDFFRD